MRSIAAAIDAVQANGDSVELILVRDRPDAPTRHEVDWWSARSDLSFTVRVLDVDLGESGASRNAGAEASVGTYVAFIDGDDLVSSNYLSDSVRMLRGSDGRTIIHPHRVISFGARSIVWEIRSTVHGDVDYKALVRNNQWPSSSVAPATIYREIPFRSLRPGDGYGPEDWIWNIDTAAAGIAHDVAPETTFFYRVKARSGVNVRHVQSILPAFDFEALRNALPVRPPTPTSGRSLSPRSLGQSAYRKALPTVRRLTRRLTPEERARIYTGVRRAYRTALRLPHHRMTAHLKTAFEEASHLDPAISWTAFDYETLELWAPRDDGYADALEQALDDLRDHAGAIVVVPWVGIGGADLVSRNYARALEASPEFGGRTSILATDLADNTQRELIPTGVNFVQLSPIAAAFWPEQHARLVAQIVILSEPKLLVSVNGFHLTRAMERYGTQISDGRHVFATLFAFDHIGPGYPVNPITNDSEREYLDDLTGVITDNTTTARLLSEILAIEPPRVQIHRQPAMEQIPELRRDSRAYSTDSFTAAEPFRLLWPHRLDKEKRPDAVVAIARSLRERGIPAKIDVWGQRVLSGHGDHLMKDFAEAGVTYRGPYSGGISALPTGDYHALLLTSESEGLPLVLVQSLLSSLPVIASGVGGVPDIIVDGETGLLTLGPDDTDGFVDAIEHLMTSPDDRRRIIETGYAFGVEHHSWESFTSLVDETLIRP